MLDGFSIANAGLYIPASSVDILRQAEKTASDMSKVGIKKADESAKAKLDKNNDESTSYEGRDTEKNQTDEEKEAAKQAFIDKKKYGVKFNLNSNMIELVDFKNGKILETISPNDLVNLVKRSKNPSGILVDEAI